MDGHRSRLIPQPALLSRWCITYSLVLHDMNINYREFSIIVTRLRSRHNRLLVHIFKIAISNYPYYSHPADLHFIFDEIRRIFFRCRLYQREHIFLSLNTILLSL